MTTLPLNKLDPITLHIKDEALAEQHAQRRQMTINLVSRAVATVKLLNCVIYSVGILTEGALPWPALFQMISVLAHFAMIFLVERFPQFQIFHASVSLLSYSQFTLNGSTVSTDQPHLSAYSDLMASMMGFIMVSYTSSFFLSLQWYYTAFGQLLSTYLVASFFLARFEASKMVPALLTVLISSIYFAYFVELKDKEAFLQMKQIEVYSIDLKNVLHAMPEGVMIYKRFGNPHIKLWNDELIRLFQFHSLPNKEDDKSEDGVEKIASVDDLDENEKMKSHLKEFLTKKILLPLPQIVENSQKKEQKFSNPILSRRPISIETALIYGESDRFYSVIDEDQEKREIFEDYKFEKHEMLGLHVVNINFDNDPCSMIMFRNWTHNFKYQFAQAQSQLSDMITSTVSQEIRRPMARVITNLEELEKMVEGDDKAYQIARESKNSSKLFIFLVHDMLDIFNFKNDKFEKIREEVEIVALLDYCVDLFRWKCMDKGIRLRKELSEEDGK